MIKYSGLSKEYLHGELELSKTECLGKECIGTDYVIGVNNLISAADCLDLIFPIHKYFTEGWKIF